MPRTAGIRRLPALPAFEDWTPPWKEGEFDAEKAKKLVYDLHKDKETLFAEIDTKVKEVEELEDEIDEIEAKAPKATEQGKPAEGESEIAALRREIAELTKGTQEKPKTRREIREAKEAEAAKDESGGNLDAERYRIALEKGMTASAARRLVGKTVEELEADADAYLEENGGGKGGQAPPSNRPKVAPKVKVKTGTAGDDAEDGEIDPGKLYDEVMGT